MTSVLRRQSTLGDDSRRTTKFKTNNQAQKLNLSASTMGHRPRVNRNASYQSQPDTDFDQYDMFDSPRGRSPPADRQRPRRQERRTRVRRRPTELHDEQESDREHEEPAPDTAKVMKSLNYIRLELEYLSKVNIISREQMAYIMSELPENIPVLYSERRKHRRRRHHCCGNSSGDGNGEAGKPKTKEDTLEFVINVAKKFGNSAMFGLGATFAGDMMKHALNAVKAL